MDPQTARPPPPPTLPQKAAIAAARAAKPAAPARGRGRSSSRSPTPPRSKKGRKKDWASLMSWDESDSEDDWGPELEPLVSPTKAAALVRRAGGGWLGRRCGGQCWQATRRCELF